MARAARTNNGQHRGIDRAGAERLSGIAGIARRAPTQVFDGEKLVQPGATVIIASSLSNGSAFESLVVGWWFYLASDAYLDSSIQLVKFGVSPGGASTAVAARLCDPFTIAPPADGYWLPEGRGIATEKGNAIGLQVTNGEEVAILCRAWVAVESWNYEDRVEADRNSDPAPWPKGTFAHG